MAALAPDLANEITAQVPEGYVLLPGSATTTYRALPTSESSTSGSADLKEQGTIRAVVFPNTALAKAIATTALSGNYHGEPIMIANASSLNLAAPAIPTSDATTFSFGLSGTTNLVYVVDAPRIAAAVAGKSRDDAQTALSNYPEVNSAVLVLRPFWRTTFPEDPSAIKVTLESTP